MRFRLEVEHHLSPALAATVARLESLLFATHNRLEKHMSKIAEKLAALQQAVQADTEVTASAVRLLEGMTVQLEELKAELADLGDGLSEEQEAAIDEVIAASRANTDALASAVAANTPAEEDPEVPPAEDTPVPAEGPVADEE